MKTTVFFLLFSLLFAVTFAQKPAEQIKIPIVEQMPSIPTPYKMKDWKQIAIRQDKLLYDHNAKGKFLPLIWWDDTKVNFPIRSFGLPSYVGSLRNMEKGNHYESLPTIGSLVGASLIGIDKSNYEGYDYVTMVRQLYNRSIGYNLVLNSVGRRAGETFWYDIFPTMAFTMLVDLYPNKPDMAEVMMGCADTWNGAVTDMKGNAAFPDFNYTGFDFKSRKGMYNKRWREPDAAAGVAWLQYAAWKKFGGDKYLDAAKSSMEFLQQRPARDGVFYEILMPYGACLAVRMNAEMGTNYDELKMLNWCFDGNNSDRDGWGVMCEKWGEYDVHGLVGQKKWEQYAFAMNTFSQAAALVPIVKYNPAYSQTIGKWILNLANASRLFYADEHPRNRQTSAIWNGDPDHVICYEGVRKNLTNGNHFESLQGVLADKGPYALGDQVKTLSSFTDICPYGSAWVGMLASIVDTTNVEKILKLNCNATDFFGDRSFPTFLLFNPFYEPRTVQLEVGKNSVNVYDLVSKQYLKKNVSGTVDLPLNENSAVTLVLIPANVKTSIKGNRLMAGNSVIDYRYK